MRCECRHCWYLQSSNRRSCLYARGADGRSLDGFIAAYPHLLCYRHLFQLYPDGGEVALRFHAYRSMGARPCAGVHPAGRILRFRESLFHESHVGMRGILRPTEAVSVCQTAFRRYHPEQSHLPLPIALWRRIFGCQHSAEGQDGGRLGYGDEQFTLLWPQSVACALYRTGNLYQGVCHLGNQWFRRLWRNLCSIAFHRRFCRLLLRPHLEHLQVRYLYPRAELYADGHGRCDDGRDACTADGHLPDSRTYWRLSALHPADDRVHLLAAYHQHLREPQYLCAPTGKGRQVAYPPYRQGSPHADGYAERGGEGLSSGKSRPADG